MCSSATSAGYADINNKSNRLFYVLPGVGFIDVSFARYSSLFENIDSTKKYFPHAKLVFKFTAGLIVAFVLIELLRFAVRDYR